MIGSRAKVVLRRQGNHPLLPRGALSPFVPSLSHKSILLTRLHLLEKRLLVPDLTMTEGQKRGSGYEAAQRSREDSADQPASSGNKRQRIALACASCRTRKTRVCLKSVALDLLTDLQLTLDGD